MKKRIFWTVLAAFVPVCGLVLAGCPNGGDDNDLPWVSGYAVGDTGPGGGKVFYVSEAGFTLTANGRTYHFLEAAPANSASGVKAWASAGFAVTVINGAQGTAVGTGWANTAAILAADPNAPAAKACADLIRGGNGWFLPSRDELNELYRQKDKIGGLGTAAYSSSSEVNNGNGRYVYVQDFANGLMHEELKSGSHSVRPVRAF